MQKTLYYIFVIKNSQRLQMPLRANVDCDASSYILLTVLKKNRVDVVEKINI